MEAAVLGRAVMTDVNSNSLDAELEVKKLQELVRKLERQNEQLRCQAGGYHHLPGAMPTLLCQASVDTLCPPQEPFEYFHPHAGEEEDDYDEEASEPSVLDELDLLDLESLSCSDESDETWLYAASKAGDSSAESLSPLQWCRQNLESPKSDVEAARRSLSLRLEQVSRWRSSLSPPTTTSPGTPPTPAPAVSSPLANLSSTPPLKERYAAPLLSSPLHPVLPRTLSPIGKELSPLAERSPTFLPHPTSRSCSLRRSTLSPHSSVDSDLGTSEVEEDSISLGYKLQDLTDVQVMARLQEESLRQDYASTSSVLANRRSQSFTFQLSQLSAGPGLEEEDEEDDEDYGLLPPPQPRLTRLQHSHTFSSVRDWRRSTSSLCTPPSTPSTPPYLSAGFAFQAQPPTHLLGLGSLFGGEPQGFNPGSVEHDNKLRRSMPNLVRAPSMPSVPIPTTSSASSASLLRNSQSFDSSSSLARLQTSIPAPGQLQNRVQSLGSFSSLSRQPLKATAYVSPTIKGSTSTSLTSLNSSGNNSGIPLLSKPAGGGSAPSVTTARSSLPRPASFMGPTSSSPRSKLAVSSRSLLTPPKSLSTFSALRDGAWRDGCY
ncbi:SLAIN motif-containing protein 1-like isoform X1 [Cyprinodon tularosa]|uniref:SLAIN motif-containing protein 1-like isoform X1 n=1 Tax=Cyprinodon tularosa TaxID=77115 RepID=UPI0018E26B5F|nr:SLAIN motif-containing protein 1-like isoform X1 [Cyprinodon tularosa]